MATAFNLPEVSEGVEAADISEILVAVGDKVEKGQLVMEVETEKAVAAVEIPFAGTITEILVSEGDTVKIGAPLLNVEQGEGAAAPAAEPKSDAPAAKQPAAKQASAEAAPAKSAAPAKPAATVSTAPDGDRPPAPAAPSVRRLARELGVNLYDVSGSARGGRILAEDVKAHAEGGAKAGGANRLIASDRGGVDSALIPAAGAGAMTAPDLPDFSQYGVIRRERMNKIAKTAAAHLSYAWHSIPHVTQHDEADITALEAARKAYGAGAGKNGPKVTMTAILAKAVAGVLKEHPIFNSSLDLGSGEIIYKEYINIGIAVDTDAGLVVPVIRDVDQKSILEIAADLTEIAGRARDRKLGLEEMRGGTFTISNLGGIGGGHFTPIVNHPEVAILGVSRGKNVVELDASGKPVQKLMVPLSLSYDHRVINGADGARFIRSLNIALSDFMALLVNA
ncbi:2-oxo acid dehydrogenase subunit E2 [Alienimonas californiensis]|uniref:Dihydrolipoamide acetyltransferase component of pyruvate dehydrogenase complex n=1 Tax=Alienimonas californiensis TaxID=2527989 RepID=A0A517P972_9PLAN|nr:2-oxo acid dehydrogenase subunit E2 [Alienimonas californiensis]QDT15922.1 Dihydrolipoyllysine-residue acetyltransferase component of pyruvate dehydrogenase complex [Alienimonas californiensis]